MNASETLSNLAAALAIAQADARDAFKGGHNKFDNYRYATYETISAAAKPVLAANGMSVVFTASEMVALDDRTTAKGGTEHVVRIRVDARLLHKSGEWMETSAWGEGQDRADKAPYKAMTGAKKYLLAGLLAIATTDDPEADESVGQSEGSGRSQPSTAQKVEAKKQEAIQAPKAPSAGSGSTQTAGANSSKNGSSPAGKPASQTTGATAPASSTTATTSTTDPALEAARKKASDAFAELLKIDEFLARGIWLGTAEHGAEVRADRLVQALLEVQSGLTAIGDHMLDVIDSAKEATSWPKTGSIQKGPDGKWPTTGWPNLQQIDFLIKQLKSTASATVPPGDDEPPF